MYSCIYVLSFLLLVIEIMLYPKKDKKVMLLTELSLSIISVLCYGVIVARGYSLIGVPVNILTISISYMCACAILLIALLRKKAIQKLYYDRWQVFAVLIFSAVFLFFEIKTFSYELRASFVNMHDAAGHFGMAMEVLRKETVSKMPFSPFHNAMMIEVVSPWLPEYKYYKGFILADSLHYYFELIFFYSLTLEFNHKKSSKYVSIVITLLYWIGYPLYSYVIGNFVYWGWGVLLCGYVIYLARKIIEEKIGKIYYIGVVLGLIGIVECYMLFAPMILCALGVLWCPKIWRDISRNKNIVFVVVGVLSIAIALVAGAIYTFFGKQGIAGVFQALQEEGWIYSNLGSDFVLTLPIIIAFIFSLREKKQYSAYMIVLLCTIGVMVFMLLLTSIKIMSAYYYCKYYYVIWFFWWLVVLNGIDEIDVKPDAVQFVKVYGWVLVIAYTCCFIRLDKMVPEQLLENNAGLLGTSLYTFNFSFLDKDYEEYKYSSDSMDVNRFVKEILIDNEKRTIMINYDECRNEALWYRAMTGDPTTNYIMGNYWDEEWKVLIEQSDQYDYFVIPKISSFYQENIDYFEQYSPVFENDDGLIIEKIKY